MVELGSTESRLKGPLHLQQSQVVRRKEASAVGSVNRKAARDEMAHAMQVIREAFPDLQPVFSGHSSYGGHRAPRDRTISFRLRDQWGKYHSNAVWILPQYLGSLTVASVRALVADANGSRGKKRKGRR
jgi:hypothetical protein